MPNPPTRDLKELAQLLASSRFDATECHARLVALEGAHSLKDALPAVRALAAARRAEGRSAAQIRRVLGALAEQNVGNASAQPSPLFVALFGGAGRNTYFDGPGLGLPPSLSEENRWHELIVALETGDEDARKVVLEHTPAHANFSRPTFAGNQAYVLNEWELIKRQSKIDGAPLERQVRWILDCFTRRSTSQAARGLALQLGLDVPQDNNNEYSVAAAVSLVAQLPEGFPEWDELFELTMLELKEAHIGTTIGEALATLKWDAVADERKNDTLTIRRSFRGHEVKWTTRLWRVGLGKRDPAAGDVHKDSKGTLSSRRLRRPLGSGVRWATLLDQGERARFFELGLQAGEVFALPELLEAGVGLQVEQVPSWLKVPQLRAMAPHLTPALAAELLEHLAPHLTARGVLALLDRVTPTDAQLVGFASQGMTEVFDALTGQLSQSTRLACLSAAEAAHHEGTAYVLRNGPPPPLKISRIEVRLGERTPPVPSATKKKPRKPVTIELPVEANLEPVAVSIMNDRIHLITTLGDVSFERRGEAWVRVPTSLRSQRVARGDGFTLIESVDTSTNRWAWSMWVDGHEPHPLQGQGAAHPAWSEGPTRWAAAGGRLVVVGTFQHGAVAFPVSRAGELEAPAELAPNKVSGVLTDGVSVLVRRPASVELYERASQKTSWRRTHESTFSPAGWAVFNDRFALTNSQAQTKHGRGAVNIYRRSGEGWRLEREVIAPRPKVEGFGTVVGLAGDTLVVSSSEKQGLRWLFPDVSRDEAHALPVAGKSRWALQPTLLVDAHRGKQRGAPLALSLHALNEPR